jgi:ABC-type glycerol-3-phosphate transport system substrate-binding protein
MLKPVPALLALSLSAGLSACAVTAVPALTPTASAPTIEAPLDTPAATDGTVEPVLPESSPVLTVWTTERVVPSDDTAGGEELLAQLAAFDESHPDIQVEFYVKRVSGPGSTLAYLRSAPPVAPGVLPDLALVDRDTLVQAATEGLIVPIETLVDPAIVSALYPAASQLGTVGEQLMGLPYVLEVQHMVYRETAFEQPPASFEAVLASPIPYVFPAGTLGNVSHTLLLQYMAAGGRLADEAGVPVLDVVPLTQVLDFYVQAHEAGKVDTALFQITDPAETWHMYLERRAGLAVVTSTLYLAGRSEARSTGLCWIPTPTGEPFALASGWSWVVVTPDPDQQARAMALVNFLMNPVNQGTYTQAAGWLPSQQAALAVWGDDDPYLSFGHQLLSNARPLPDVSLRAVVGPAIQDALEDVLLNGVAPAQAATRAAQLVNPPGTPQP